MHKSKKFYFLIPVIVFVVFVIFIAGCNERNEVEKIKKIVHTYIEETWNNGNMNVLDEFFTADYVYHIPPYPDVVGIEAYKKFIGAARKSYPDLKITIHETIAEGNKCIIRWITEGTQTGGSPIFHIAPTGKHVKYPGCAVFHFVDGKIAEAWEYVCWISLMKQLGFKFVPPSAASGE